MTTQQLRQERPFLWLGIMSASSKSVPQQLALRARMRAILAQRMMLEFRKDLDLLLGIFIYLSWANYQLPQRLSLCLFMQLANSLVFDLGLNRSHTYDHLTPFGPHLCPSVPTSGPRTMEERRAVLGCYYLSSMISINLKRIDSLMDNPYGRLSNRISKTSRMRIRHNTRATSSMPVDQREGLSIGKAR
ncbi:hypothetical protein LIPSTDRAFT_101368 [Lipomyces starkeyi NRRL Y-11557]|uniref:Uncharacterized protein n=1 Tax=Lipomyces starkeyi NRRL Y-11557 TaxID=675824 RepID=A0A1E3QF15_LIPST|nr:hypothetical protein LIPSTDRAFT_101368 [Lipomyces starkeyi NRRL Y-11557]